MITTVSRASRLAVFTHLRNYALGVFSRRQDRRGSVVSPNRRTFPGRSSPSLNPPAGTFITTTNFADFTLERILLGSRRDDGRSYDHDFAAYFRVPRLVSRMRGRSGSTSALSSTERSPST